MRKIKGKYTNSVLEQQLSIHDPPTTSAQDLLTIRANDTSSDILYPSTRYKSVKSIGDGSASLILEGYDLEENKKVIIKKISKKECWRQELETLKKLRESTSGRILRYLDFFESHRCSYIVTEFYDGLDLFEHIDINVPYSLRKGMLLILEMAKCIKECHDNNIIHLDIKCENYMVKSQKLFLEDKPNIVLIDFGHAEIIPQVQSIHQLRRGFNYGTSYFTCPEGYLEKIYSSKSDIWSLGVCLCLLLTADYPYKGRKQEYYHNSTLNNISLSKDLDAETISLIKASLHSNPLERINIDDFISRVLKILSSLPGRELINA